MTSISQVAYEKVKTRLLRAPGMIEESERRLLFKAAFDCKNLAIVEFGAFFGASTVALASGAISNGENHNPVICVDAFEVDINHNFYKYVINYAKKCNAEKLLSIEGSKVN